MGLPGLLQCWGRGLVMLTGPLAQGWDGHWWARDPAQVPTWSAVDMRAHSLLLNRCSLPSSPFTHENSPESTFLHQALETCSQHMAHPPSPRKKKM